jgi:hypothetical protein
VTVVTILEWWKKQVVALREWWPLVWRSTHEAVIEVMRRRIEEQDTRHHHDLARIRALVWWRGMEPPKGVSDETQETKVQDSHSV